MRKLTLSLGIAFLSLSLFAQQAEIDATNQAFKNNDFKAAVKSGNDALELLKDNNTFEPEVLEEFLYSAGRSAQNLGDIRNAAKFYALLNRIETKPYFKIKNKDTGNWEYYLYQSVAEKARAKGNYSRLKKGELSTKYISKVLPELSKLANDDLKLATDAFQNKDYETAAQKFSDTYLLSKALGNENKLYLYYSALSGMQTKKKKQATHTLQFLADRNFDGVQTTYSATNVATGQRVNFANQKDMNKQVQIGICRDPKVETSQSLEGELYNYLVFGYYQTQQYDKGIAAAKKALEKFPDNKNISDLLSSMYYKSGKTEEFIAELQTKVNNNTATAIDYFNLAKMLDDTKADKATVHKYYKAAIDKDPNMTNAYLNLSLSIIQPETEYVKLMNANLGSTPKEKKIYKENAEKRKVLYQEALPYLEKAYSLDQNNASLIKILENTYDVLGNDKKFFEMKEKLKNM